MNKLILVLLLMLSGFNNLVAQSVKVKLSGKVLDQATQAPLPYVNVLLKKKVDSTFVTGSITDEAGLFILNDVPSGEYVLEADFLGYESLKIPVYVGSNSQFLNLGELVLKPSFQELGEIEVVAQQDAVSNKLDKKPSRCDNSGRKSTDSGK
jgi:hypothetical protein